jgi:transposase InsO family protein/transposase
MQLHANAALSLNGRRAMVGLVVDHGLSIAETAERFRVSEKTCRKWLCRFLAEGPDGLRDRSSAPKTVANKTPADRVEAIAALRRLRFTAEQIAEVFDMALSTVSGILLELGMGKLGRLGLQPAVRYERERPGELIHIDVKKLGRIQGGAGKRVRDGKRQHYMPTFTDQAGRRRRTVGWDFVHIAIDDATRLAYAEILSDEKGTTAAGFLRRAIAFFERHGMTVEQVLTDNGSAYISAVHAVACRTLGIRHLRTRPRRPQTNGKAERFIRTMLGGWAYSGAIYASSAERAAALDGWLHHYNHHRRHSALGHKPPMTRLTERNNLLGTYI